MIFHDVITSWFYGSILTGREGKVLMWAVFMNLRFELDLAKKNPKAAVAAAAKCLTLMVVLPTLDTPTVPVGPLYEIRICRASAKFQKLFKK